jgi:hypothetical protein
VRLCDELCAFAISAAVRHLQLLFLCLQSGDVINIDVAKRVMDVDISDAEWAKRKVGRGGGVQWGRGGLVHSTGRR